MSETVELLKAALVAKRRAERWIPAPKLLRRWRLSPDYMQLGVGGLRHRMCPCGCGRDPEGKRDLTAFSDIASRLAP